MFTYVIYIASGLDHFVLLCTLIRSASSIDLLLNSNTFMLILTYRYMYTTSVLSKKIILNLIAHI